MENLPNFERFEIRRHLGRGGVGSVYLAYDRERKEEVALKVVQVANCAPDMLEAERSGVKLHQQLGHVAPQIVPVYAYGDEGSCFWVAMEYVPGVDLAALLKEGPLETERAVRIAVQLCDLLGRMQRYASESNGRKSLGVVHGDLKPENIRIPDGRVRVFDFGIAKPLSVSRQIARNPFGSLPYIPPERLTSNTVNEQSDSWAVGVILYYMLNGHLPFSGSTASEMERQIIQGDLLSFSSSRPLGLQWIVYKSLAHEPSGRYRTVADMKKDLEEILSGETKDCPPESLQEVMRQTRPSLEGERLRAQAPAPVQPTPRIFRKRILLRKPQAVRRFQPALWLIPLLLVSGCSAFVWNEAKEIHRDLATADVSRLDPLWERYRSVGRLSPFGWWLGDLPQEMRSALEDGVEAVFRGPSGDDQRASVDSWERALRYSGYLFSLESTTPREKARIIYCQGHLRLTAWRNLTGSQADSKLRDAIAEFQRVQKVDDTWPLPYLSLARIYVYRKLDFAQSQRLIQGARRRGFSDEGLLVALSADGHLREGRRIQAQTDKDGDLRLMGRARKHFEEAVRLYPTIPQLRFSGVNLAEAKARLERIKKRMLVES